MMPGAVRRLLVAPDGARAGTDAVQAAQGQDPGATGQGCGHAGRGFEPGAATQQRGRPG